MLQPPDLLHGTPLDLLEQVYVFLMLRTPELSTVLQMESHRSGIEGENYF